MHSAILLLAILELPGGLRVPIPKDVCVSIDVRGEVMLRRAGSKETLLLITPDAEGYACSDDDCHESVVSAGTSTYGLAGQCEWVGRLVTSERVESHITRPRTDAACSVEPIFEFVYSSNGVAAHVMSVTIWSDGEVEADDKRGLLTVSEVNEIRRLISYPSFTDLLHTELEEDNDLAGFSIVTPTAAAGFLVDRMGPPPDYEFVDAVPPGVRETLMRIDAIVAPHVADYEHPMKLRE